MNTSSPDVSGDDFDADAKLGAVFGRGAFEAGAGPGSGYRRVAVSGLVEQSYSDDVVGQARGSDHHGEDDAGRVGDDTPLTAGDLLVLIPVPG